MKISLKHLSKKEKKAVLEFKKRLLQKLDNQIYDILLYGSKARGDAKETSDIDILVIIDSESRSDSKKVSSIAFDIMLEYNVPLSEIVIPKSRWHKYLSLPTSFSYTVQKEAVKI